MTWKTGLVLFSCVTVLVSGWAQRPAGSLGRGSDPGQRSNSVHFEPDTLQVALVSMHDPSNSTPFDDTLLHHFHEFDLNQLQGTSYFGLGYPGSPVRSVIPQAHFYTGFRIGLDQFTPYRLDDQSFRFLRLKKAFTHATYTQGRSQEEGIIRALFSRDFKDGINLTLDYNRYNNLGVYTNQGLQNTNLGVGLWLQSKDEKLHLFLTHYSNVFDQNDNGGITTDSLFNSPFFDQRITIPVHLQAANTRDQERTYGLLAQYQLTGDDSLARSDGLRAQYQIRISNRRYRFFDSSPPVDNDYYMGFVTDSRGLRQFIQHRQLTNSARLQFEGRGEGQLIAVGLRNVVNQIMQEPLNDVVTEWFGDGSVSWKFGDRVELISMGEIGVNSDNASFLFSGDLQVDLGVAGSLSGRLSLNRRGATLIERKLFISQEQIWDHDFQSLTINELEATYYQPKLGIRLTAGQRLTSNPIYFSTAGIPTQLDEIVSLTYFKVVNTIRLGKVYSENKIVLQTAGNSAVFRIPKWYSEHSLYFLGPLFKKVLNLNVGFDYRMHTGYDGITYHPLVGQFINEDDFKIPFYPYIDFRVGFRVKYFRAFFMLHNVLKPLRDDVYFQTSRYPYEDLHLRVGIGWTFIN
ncbi:MAG: putative porin [Saprospiraceae bacterium]|nr:putative porin [Saprospiraceae bacterium]